MSSKGYITIAQNSGNVDYIRMAYALALSIKNTQSHVRDFAICVVNKSDVPQEYEHAFDHIIEIPWKDHAADSDWKIENKWKYYYMSPFDETIVLDADMIFTSDISYWWEFLVKKDVWATTSVRNFRNKVVDSDHYRKVFTKNRLPNIYTAFMFFRKCDLSAELFKMTEIIYNNWENFYYNYLDNGQKFVSGDVSFALAMKLLGIENDCTNVAMTALPTFTHMKPYVQGIPSSMIGDNWIDHLPTYLRDDGSLKIGNFEQILPLHYHDKEWLTDEIISKLGGNII